MRRTLVSLLLALGLACGTALALSAIPLPARVARLWPVCPARQAGGRCALCGMRRSFTAMSRGQVVRASACNPAGPWLYLAFVLQTAAGAVGALLLSRPPKK